jgi:hypothetical protein
MPFCIVLHNSEFKPTYVACNAIEQHTRDANRFTKCFTKIARHIVQDLLFHGSWQWLLRYPIETLDSVTRRTCRRRIDGSLRIGHRNFRTVVSITRRVSGHRSIVSVDEWSLKICLSDRLVSSQCDSPFGISRLYHFLLL